MKRLIFLSFFLFVPAALLKAQRAVHKAIGPVLKIVGDESFDMGEIGQGPEAIHKFTFVNTGDQPLEIKDIINSSAYAGAEWTKEPIQPGKKGVITTYMNTKPHDGEFLNNYYVRSNAVNSGNGLGIKLHVKGTINAAASPVAETKLPGVKPKRRNKYMASN